MNSLLFNETKNSRWETLIAWMLGTATIHIKPLIDASKNIPKKNKKNMLIIIRNKEEKENRNFEARF